MKTNTIKRSLTVLVCLILTACSSTGINTHATSNKLLIYGASGRIGGYIVKEALMRGFDVTGVTRDSSRLDNKYPGVTVVEGDILDRKSLRKLMLQHQAVLVSVGGKPTSEDPARYIAALAATSLVDVLSSLGDRGPRVLFVGNLYTLEIEPGKTVLDVGRAKDHPNLAMFQGHQLALDTFRASKDIKWTVASPPNGLRLKNRTGLVRWGDNTVLRDEDGTPSSISPEDFAYAVLEELQAGRYVGKRFTVAK